MVEYKKEIKIGKFTASINYRPAFKNILGRFGGGWDWVFGLQLGRGLDCLILNCLIFYIRFEYEKNR